MLSQKDYCEMDLRNSNEKEKISVIPIVTKTISFVKAVCITQKSLIVKRRFTFLPLGHITCISAGGMNYKNIYMYKKEKVPKPSVEQVLRSFSSQKKLHKK